MGTVNASGRGGWSRGEAVSAPQSPQFPAGLGCFGSALLAHQPWGTGTNTGVLSCLFKGDPTKSPVTGSPHRPLSPSLASKLSLDTERSSLAGTLGTSRRCHQHRGSSGMSTHGVTHRLTGCSGLYPRGPSGIGVSMADGVRLIPKRGSPGGGIALQKRAPRRHRPRRGWGTPVGPRRACAGGSWRERPGGGGSKGRSAAASEGLRSGARLGSV